MTLDMAQEPNPSPLAASDAPPEVQPPPGPPEAFPHDDVEQDVKQAIIAGATVAKAFATGNPDSVDVEKYQRAMQGVQAGLMGLAAIHPPTRPVDPNAMQADHTRAAAAVLQDQQHEEDVKLQRELAQRREGRPGGATKPVTSKQ